MKLEAGKFYKTRNGLKFGPAEEVYPFGSSGWMVPSNNGHPATYDSYGNRISPCCSNEEDLVSEWHDGPVRTVTRREIVDGTYGIASISTYDETRCRIGLEKNILTAEDFRELAHLASQLAEALEDKS